MKFSLVGVRFENHVKEPDDQIRDKDALTLPRLLGGFDSIGHRGSWEAVGPLFRKPTREPANTTGTSG